MHLKSFFLAFGIVFGIFQPAYGQGVSSELLALEQTAQNLLEAGKPKDAIGIYHLYELQMVEEGWDMLQPDLLSNLAIAHYRAGDLGAAMANLKQLNILDHSAKVESEIQDLQMLIEHQTYQIAPNTAFVRGHSSDYWLWESVHRFSSAQLDRVLLLVWSLLFLSVGVFLLVPGLKKSRVVFVCLVGTLTIFVMGLGGVRFQHHRTDDQLYGVLMDTSSLRHKPGYEALKVDDPAFVCGLTVSVVSSVEGWLKIERSDGVTAWMDVNDFYLLRGVGDQRSHQLPSALQ